MCLQYGNIGNPLTPPSPLWGEGVKRLAHLTNREDTLPLGNIGYSGGMPARLMMAP